MSSPYTIPFFINKVQQVQPRNLVATPSRKKGKTVTIDQLFSDQRNGNRTARNTELERLLGGRTQLKSIILGTGRFKKFGKSVKARVLAALRLRAQRKL